MTTELEVCRYPGCHDEARIAGYCLEHAEEIIYWYERQNKEALDKLERTLKEVTNKLKEA